MDFATYIDFLKRMFLSDTETFTLNPDLVRDIVFTAVTFFIGWALSLKASKHRLKSRIIDELLLSQRELVVRAYPETRDGRWKAGDVREVWMLDPFVARIRFLVVSLQEEKSLKLNQLDLLERYVSALEDFIAEWARTRARRATYHYKYEQSYRRMREAAVGLGLHQTKRLNGLMPRDELMNGIGKDPSPSSPSPATTPSGLSSSVPAE